MKCFEKNCKLEVIENDNKCILHSEDKDKDIQIFWKRIRDDLSKKYICNEGEREIFNHEVIYKNIQFPKFEEENFKDYESESNRCISDEESNFYFINSEEDGKNYIDEIINDCNIKFENCTFWDEVKLERYDFQNIISFVDCTFEKEIFIKDEINSIISFINCDFKNQKFDISNRIFNKNFILIECKNVELIIINTYFKSTFSLSRSNINKAIFDQTNFEDMAIFIDTKFTKDISFNYCIFSNHVFLNGCEIHTKIDLKNAIFKSETNFIDIKNKYGKDLKAENIDNRETARIIKNYFEKQNNIIEANKFYALEMRKREKELSCKGPVFEFIIFYLHKITSKHSQSWILVLSWIVFVSILGIENTPMESITKLLYGQNYLDLIANSFYSIFKFDGSDITIYKLILKLFMGYLIYQFIVSIRQNTRRK